MFRTLTNSKNKEGFTIIEVLVAVAIVTLLSTIVLVSIGKSRIRSENNAVVRQVREYMTALEITYRAAGNHYPAYAAVPAGAYESNGFLKEQYIACLSETNGVGSQTCRWDGADKDVFPDEDPIDGSTNTGMIEFRKTIDANTGLPVEMISTAGVEYDSIMYLPHIDGRHYILRYPLKGDSIDCIFEDATEESSSNGITICEYVSR